ncbi:hypothetical protein FLK61_38915 [Paenalkalicoccus suaedae]|uniref:RelA/SpoT domain-containing protein n=1 Tax=Paenalkalicoccus suaedae TaxID=2592382 RepID=A0A859FIQ9_9BACI|nr:hypothetical protein [Paenalkalicoccus suaedae]QKS72592.1 hypothetical protein FLK61_38915 [Paenalkalicoccus suaedae]
MTNISNDSLKAEIIQTYNSHLKKELEICANEISELFRVTFDRILKDESTKYLLTHDNAGYLGNYYKVTHRVKSELSLGEKLVRKNDLLHIKNMIDYKDDNKVIEYLKQRYSDLIGLKILGDLKQDTYNIIQLIKDNKNSFKNINPDYYITFENLEEKQAKMRNGLDIIKVDCIFHKNGEKYLFELQIKSQLMSAWGDMEHQQFYKNNKFSIVRKSNEPIMSDIGKLLDRTDELLFTIRSSEKNYSQNGEMWEFNSKLQSFFSAKLEEVLSVKVDSQLLDLGYFLHLLSRSIDPNYGNLNSNLDVFKLIKDKVESERESQNPIINNYLKHCKFDFDLQIIEIVTLHWYESLNEEVSSEEKYIDFLNWYLEKILEVIIQLHTVDVEDSIVFDAIFYKVIEESNHNIVYKDINCFTEIVEYYKATKDVYLEKKEEDEEVFGLEMFYDINYLFAIHTINNTPFKREGLKNTEKDITLLDSFFDYLNKEAKGSLEKFQFISEDIRRFLREGY